VRLELAAATLRGREECFGVEFVFLTIAKLKRSKKKKALSYKLVRKVRELARFGQLTGRIAGKEGGKKGDRR